MVRRRRPAPLRGDRGTAEHRDRAAELKDGQGIPVEMGEGDEERGALGTWVDGAPQGGEGTEGQREVFKELSRHGERSSAVSPRTERPHPLGGGGSFAQGLVRTTPMSLPGCGLLHPNPSPRSGSGPCPHVPVTLCVPTSTCLCALYVSLCPLPHTCSHTRIPVPHARPRDTMSPAPHVSLCRWLYAPCLSLCPLAHVVP